MEKEKRGVSPIIATVLLIGMVIVSGLIVFMWFRGFVGESVTKFEGTNIELVCADVQFDADVSGSSLYISNYGNVPIYEMRVKQVEGGSFSTGDLSELSTNKNWPATGLTQGGVFSDTLTGVSAETIFLIPVLIGTSSAGKQEYTCDEQYAYELAWRGA